LCVADRLSAFSPVPSKLSTSKSLPLPEPLLDTLDKPAHWQAFQAHKLAKSQLTRREADALAEFVEKEGYREPVRKLRDGDFPYPQRREVNKSGSTRKRVVYTFPESETWVLKLLAFELYRYDAHQPPGCYSFRRGTGAHMAVRELAATPGIEKMWCYKADVHDYFNSISVPLLIDDLGCVIGDDPDLLGFITGLLSADKAWEAGRLLEGPRGAMAGMPLSPFLANIHLASLDARFFGVRPYARYSDDIVVFAETREEIDACRAVILGELEIRGLSVNPDKESLSAPGEPWEFLGFSYSGGELDLSAATRKKLKAKIRRKARALRRWMLRKDVPAEKAVRVMIRIYNRKFFSGTGPDELNWSRWFFPLLTRDESLREIDHYLQQWLRWIPTGRHRAANRRLSYAKLQELGYRTLVHEFHQWCG
jgi:hypothetical protein